MKRLVKKTARTILALVAASSLLFTAACGDSNNDDTPSPTPPQQGDDKSAETEAFITEIGGVSENYTGSISEGSYLSASDAAEAFVSCELVCDSTVTVIDSERRELSRAEIDALGISAQILGGCDSVEEVAVTYSLSESRVAERNGSEAKVNAYALRYGSSWRYFSPRPQTGAVLTKSYYDSVFDPERYKNYTFEYSEDIFHSTVVDGYSMETASESLEGTEKYAYGKLYNVQTAEQNTTQNGSTTQAEETRYVYFEQTESGSDCYIKKGDSASFQKSSEYTNLKDIHKEVISIVEACDHTDFVKTDYGFALNKEKEREVGEIILCAWNMDVMLDSRLWIGEMNIELSVEYYVSDGILAGVRINLKFGGDVDSFAVMKRDATVKTIYDFDFVMKFTDYGITVVEKPF